MSSAVLRLRNLLGRAGDCESVKPHADKLPAVHLFHGVASHMRTYGFCHRRKTSLARES